MPNLLFPTCTAFQNYSVDLLENANTIQINKKTRKKTAINPCNSRSQSVTLVSTKFCHVNTDAFVCKLVDNEIIPLRATPCDWSTFLFTLPVLISFGNVLVYLAEKMVYPIYKIFLLSSLAAFLLMAQSTKSDQTDTETLLVISFNSIL